MKGKRKGQVIRVKKRIRRGKETLNVVINVRVNPSNVTVTNRTDDSNELGNGGSGGGGGINGGGGGGGGVGRR
jgi:hypothetical protein